MAIWQDTNGSLHDDMGGAALTIPTWIQGMVKLTVAQVTAIYTAQATAQATAAALLPNPPPFIKVIKTALGGPTGILVLSPGIQSAISLSLAALSMGEWSDLQAYISSMKTALDAVNTNIYITIKAAATQYNIPITL